MTQFIAYYRVSTQKQGNSGLGLDSQRAVVEQHVASVGGKVLAEHIEIESGKKAANRPKLQEALRQAGKRSNAATLIVAKLDRLARQSSFVNNLLDSKVEFVACDFPSANRFVIQIMAAVAEYEAKLISDRTKAALAARRARGLPLGNPQFLGASPLVASRKAEARAEAERLRPVLQSIGHETMTLRPICAALESKGYKTPAGNSYSPKTLSRILARLDGSYLATQPSALCL